MKPVATIGLDIAKSVFQVHGVDAAGQVVVRHQTNLVPKGFEFPRPVMRVAASLDSNKTGLELFEKRQYTPACQALIREIQALWKSGKPV